MYGINYTYGPIEDERTKLVLMLVTTIMEGMEGPPNGSRSTNTYIINYKRRQILSYIKNNSTIRFAPASFAPW